MKQQGLFATPPAPPLRIKNDVEHRALACRSILNYCDTERMPDTFTINPYRGCEFGCAYCYARYTHQFMEKDWREFEKTIYVKKGADRVLLKTLDTHRIAGRHIAIGTATDPYQPAEARFRLTRRLLEVFAQVSGLSLSITSKSSLMRRDIDLFQRIAARNDFHVNVSLISVDESFLRRLEPKASRPQARLNVLRELREAGIQAGLFIMPILPGLTDSTENLEALISEAGRLDASFVAPGVLFLMESSKPAFFSYLRRNQPHLYRRYLEAFRKRSYTPESYRREVLARVAELKTKFGFQAAARPRAQREIRAEPRLAF